MAKHRKRRKSKRRGGMTKARRAYRAQSRTCRDAVSACISARGGDRARCGGAYKKCMTAISSKRAGKTRACRAEKARIRATYRRDLKAACPR